MAYLPVRAVGEALGKKVTWDGDTRTVYVGYKPGEAKNWMKDFPPYLVNYASNVKLGFVPAEGHSYTYGVFGLYDFSFEE